MKKTILYIYLISIISIVNLFSKEAAPDNTASINGYVTETEKKETLIGATVEVLGANLGAYTNKSGFYSIGNIQPGSQIIRISYIGYETLYDTVDLKRGQELRIDYSLKLNSGETDEIIVSAEKEIEKREITVSKVNIPVKQLKNIRIGGEADIFRSLQYLPGILTSSQISSGLFVRGGSPDQNLVLVDGASVYNPSHLFGFISTFNADAIKDVELIKGGFPAEYGGRLSAVLNLTQKNGNKEEVEGNASLGLISSRASLEGPVGNGSWFIGGRRTYLELVKAFITEDPEEPLPDFNFYDMNAKITQDLSDDDRIFASGFLSSDALDYSSFGLTMGMDVGNRTGALRWTHIFGSNYFSELLFSSSHYYNNLTADQSGFEFIVNNTITDYTLKGSLDCFTTDKLTMKFGFEISHYDFDFKNIFTGEDDTTSSSTLKEGVISLDIKDINYSLFGQFNYQINEVFSVQGGLRAGYWDFSEYRTYDPRLALRYRFTEDIAIKLAWGVFHQNLRLATQPDFSFFDTWLPTDTTLKPSRSDHYIFTIETDPFEGYKLNFDVYYKSFKNISELNNNMLTAATASDVLYMGDAESYGAEIFLQKSYGKFTGWAGYALGYIRSRFDSINGGKEFNPKYDRRHDLKIVGQYELNDTWEFGASFIFQSGQSYTGASSRFEARLPGRDIGKGILVPTQRYAYRLPPSHQLNVNAAYSFKIWGAPSKLILDVYNVYNRRDIWFRYYDTKGESTILKEVRLLPILPSISMEVNF